MNVLPIQVFLSGEGTCELGVYANEKADWPDRLPRKRGKALPYKGVLHAFLRHVQPGGWEVKDARVWRSITKLQVGAADRDGITHGDFRNVCGLALDAQEAKCDVLVFSRDVDADRDRKEAIERGLEVAARRHPRLGLVGGVAVPTIEGWLLAALGESGTERLSRHEAERRLSSRASIEPKKSGPMTELAESEKVCIGLAALPSDATSLLAWLSRARSVLSDRVRERLEVGAPSTSPLCTTPETRVSQARTKRPPTVKSDMLTMSSETASPRPAQASRKSSKRRP